MQKFVVLFTRDEQGQQVVFRRRVFKILPQFVQYASKSFQIDWSRPVYLSPRFQRVYLVNWTTGMQSFPEGGNPVLRPEDLDVVVKTKIIREITQAVSDDFKLKMIWALLGGIIGALAAGLVVYIVMSNQITEILKSQINNTPVIITAFGGGLRALLA